MRGPLTRTVSHFSRLTVPISGSAPILLQAAAVPSRLRGQVFPVGKFLRANRVPFDPLMRGDQKFPDVELFISVGPSEVPLVEGVVRAATQYSLNRVVRVVLLVDVGTTLPDFELDVPIHTHLKESLLSESTRTSISSAFGERDGWVLQQFNKLAWAAQADSMGVLILDADTFLTRPRLFLDSSGNQVLLPTWEYHRPYYEVYDQLGGPLSKIDVSGPSFIAHHMLMQPQMVRELLNDFGAATVDDFAQSIFQTVDLTSDLHSSLCVDYELYGQWMYRRRLSKVRLGRWSNIGLSRTKGNLEAVQSGRLSRIGYASASFHGYLGPKRRAWDSTHE